MKQGEFCDYTGIKQQTVSGIETGRSEPSTAMLQLLFTKFPDLNPDWLLLGTGSMLRDGRFLTPTTPPNPETTPPAGGAMRVNHDGDLEGYWKAIAEERAQTIAKQEALIERLWNQNDTLIKKPEASLDAADLVPAFARMEIRKWPTACQPEAFREGKLIPLHGPDEYSDVEEAA